MVVIVTVVGVVVLGDDVLQVGVLPVQVAGLDGPREHRPVRPRERICKRDKQKRSTKEKKKNQMGTDQKKNSSCNLSPTDLLEIASELKLRY